MVCTGGKEVPRKRFGGGRRRHTLWLKIGCLGTGVFAHNRTQTFRKPREGGRTAGSTDGTAAKGPCWRWIARHVEGQKPGIRAWFFRSESS